MTIQALLDTLAPFPGLRGVAVLDLATGVCMGSGGREGMEAERFASDYARSLNAMRVHLEPQADEDIVKEMRLQLPNAEVLITPVSPETEAGLYLCLFLDLDADRLGALTSQLALIRDAFSTGTGLLDESAAEALYNYRVAA